MIRRHRLSSTNSPASHTRYRIRIHMFSLANFLASSQSNHINDKHMRSCCTLDGYEWQVIRRTEIRGSETSVFVCINSRSCIIIFSMVVCDDTIQTSTFIHCHLYTVRMGITLQTYPIKLPTTRHTPDIHNAVFESMGYTQITECLAI